jgi:hypothetical protein
MSKLVVTAVAAAAAVTLSVAAHAHAHAAPPTPHVVGTWANDQDGGTQLGGGYQLWSNGEVVAIGGAQYFGDAVGAHLENFVGMVTDYWSAGYWLVTSTGRLFGYGKVCQDQSLVGPKKLPATTFSGAVDLVDADNEGFNLVTSAGAIYSFRCS